MQQTSLLAFEGVQATLGRNQKLVLEALEKIGPANNKELAAHLRWQINSITPRVLELRKKRKVEQAYIAKDHSGRQCIYWRVMGDHPRESLAEDTA